MKRKNKVFNIFSLVFKIIISVIIIAFIFSVILQRFSNNELSFFNYRIFSVLTGSMEPVYNVGDVLISKEIEAKDIKVGDAVSYLGNSGAFDGKVITHEVINIEKDDNNELLFTTKGVANEVEDPVVKSDQIYGVVVYKSVILSTIYGIISTPIGMYLLIILPILALIGYEIISRMLEKEDSRRKTKHSTRE